MDFPALLSYLFKVFFLFFWICVIKSHNKFSFKVNLVVLIQQGSFGMTNMQIPKKEIKNKYIHQYYFS